MILELISKPNHLRHSGKPEGRISSSLSLRAEGQNLQAFRDSGQARVTGYEMGFGGNQYG